MGSFYFGGERSFSIGEDKNELSSYIVESNKFPQQTSLLGMLRFWILRNDPTAFNASDNKIYDSEKAKELIGKKSFCTNPEPVEDGKYRFGKIKEIDFCFLQKKEDDNWIGILPSPLDYKLKVEFGTQKAFYNGIKKTLPKIVYEENEQKKEGEYTDKNGLIKEYLGSKKTIKEDEIFIKDQRLGIDRDIKTGKTEESALYKQIFYRLREDYRFAFVADFEDNYKLPESGQIVELGGDSSKFILEYEDYNISKQPSYGDIFSLHGKPKLVLLSDAKLDNSIVEKHTLFSITEHIPFQFLLFNTDARQNYSRTSKNDKQGRHSLFKRGSVFYFENDNELNAFESTIENDVFQQIGYNKYESKK